MMRNYSPMRRLTAVVVKNDRAGVWKWEIWRGKTLVATSPDFGTYHAAAKGVDRFVDEVRRSPQPPKYDFEMVTAVAGPKHHNYPPA